jgi:hypothetical protein
MISLRDLSVRVTKLREVGCGGELRREHLVTACLEGHA